MTHKDRAKRRTKIVELLQEGVVSPTELSNVFGLSTSYIKNIAENNQIHTEGISKFSNYKIMADLLLTNKSLSEIARKNKISRQRVFQINSKLKEVKLYRPKGD